MEFHEFCDVKKEEFLAIPNSYWGDRMVDLKYQTKINI